MMLKLIMAMATGLAMFTVTMLVYGVGLLSGWATWSGIFIASVAIIYIAVGMVLFCVWG
jgi:predicted membrane protein